MPGTSRGLRYDAVDQQPDRASLVRYLEGLHHLPDVAAYKARTFERLGIERGLTVLDVGCGTGEDARRLADALGGTGRVLAVDLSRTMLAAVRRGGPDDRRGIDGICAEVLALPFRDASCDRCRADRVLQHVKDGEQAIAEMTRVLRPGGRLLVCDTDWETLVVDHPAVETTRLVLRRAADTVTNATIGRRLVRHCAEAGLDHVGVDAMTLTFRDLELADAVVGLRHAALDLAARGTAPLDDLADWLLELEALHQRGRFFAAVTGFAAWGTKR